MKRNLLKILILTLVLKSSLPADAQIDFSYHSFYSLLRGKDAVSLSDTWKDPGFDDSGWQILPAPFRYGDGTSGTELTDMQNSYSSIYLRSSFSCNNKDLIDELKLAVDYDDGFVIWINGTEVLRRNTPLNLQYNSLAPANHESGSGELFTVITNAFTLNEGLNLIAIQALNVSLTSSDFYFDLAITAEKNLPEVIDTVGITFSERSGFYENPFSIVMTSPDPESQIIYTLDGSNPRTSVNSIVSGSPSTVSIDPASNHGRPVTPAVILRASITKPGYKPSKPVSRTFVFIENVLSQSWPGGEWPSSDINAQIIDLEMDTEVVRSGEYSSLIDDALIDIPSISVVTDIKNLFDPASGIYVNASGHGLEWERDCSVELIMPDGTNGFNVNAGLRIRGGWSRHDDFPKHSFRLFFREEYGNAKLDYPLFGEEGADQFDKIDLRTEQNYGWNNGSRYNSFVREIFSRDSQRDMGQPYTRSRYYHLYLNGMYWGLYQTQERPEARFASTYFGGEQEDYDVVKVNMDNWAYTIEATDGQLDSWQKLWNMCSSGFATNSSYFSIEGKDEKGKPMKNSEILVDLDNLIDYMIIIFYTGNFDAPASSFVGTNNFFIIDNRENKSTGFTFYAHDAEHSLFDEAHSPGLGLYEDRVNLASRTDKTKMEVTDFSRFHPQWLHYKLSENKEYRIRFADRVYKALKTGGVFSPEESLERLNRRIAEIDMAVIAESARWGDAKRPTGSPFTKNETWIPEINKIRNIFIPNRGDIVIDQLKWAGLYHTIDAPVISTLQGIISKPEFSLSGSTIVTIKNPGNSGTIYYTFDGSDPRNIGGEVNPLAIDARQSAMFTIRASTVLKARILNRGQWSAIEQVNFIKNPEDYSNLKVTEVHYHPPDITAGEGTISGKDIEFIEFKNTGISALNLSGLILDSAVYYEFPENVLLPPRKFYVVASKPSRFYDYYGLVASGNYQGNFSNEGEKIVLEDPAGETIINFSYLTKFPWPDESDGEGYSLSSRAINPFGDPSDYSYWTNSVVMGGTPFADNESDLIEQPVPEEGTLLVYPNPTKGVFYFNLMTTDDISMMEFELYDMNGRLIHKTRVRTSDSLNLPELGISAGIYHIRVKAGSIHGDARIVYEK